MVALLLLLILPACERDMNLDGYRNPEIEKMLVVNSILNPDSLIKVSVTHPYFFTTPHLEYKPAEGLDVLISGADGRRETLTFDTKTGLYIAGRCPAPGERIGLEIRSESSSVSSIDTVPLKTEITDIGISGEAPGSSNGDYNYRFTYRISFRDQPGVDNYYFLNIEAGTGNGSFTEISGIDYSEEYVFQVLAAMINQDIQGWKPAGIHGYPFSDKGIEGKSHTITLTETVYHHPGWDWNADSLPRKISLYSISKSYFDYMLSVISMDYDEDALKGNLLSLGLMEPSRIYSNISGGAGIMGSYNLSTAVIDLLQATGGWPGQN